MSPRKQEKLFQPDYSEQLLRIAQGDLESARAIASYTSARIENAFYMLQQAIEKSIKAVLVYHQIPVPLVHDLGILIAKIPSELPAPPHGYELSELNQFASERRYQEGDAVFTQVEFHSLEEIAVSMLEWAKSSTKSEKGVLG